MPPSGTPPHSALQKAERTLSQLLILFCASVFIVFVLQVPSSQAKTGEGNKYCVGTMKCKYGGNPNKPTSKCEKKEKKVGIPGKPCKEKGNSGKYFTGKCIKTLDCKTTKTDEGKAPKKADPKGGGKGGEPKMPEMPKLPEPKPKPPKPPQETKKEDQIPCPVNPQLKQGTPECEKASKIKESRSPLQQLFDYL